MAKFGYRPWNTGLTKEIDERVKSAYEKPRKHILDSESKKVKIKCENCGKDTFKFRYSVERNKFNFCNKECYLSYHHKNGLSDEQKIKYRKTRMGKTYEEIMGIEKAKELKELQSKMRKGCKIWNKGLNKENNEVMRQIAINVSKNALINPNFGMKNKKMSEQAKEKMKLKRANRIYPLKDTTIEIKIQEFLRVLGIDYVTHFYVKGINCGYQCDIFVPSMNLVIECDGDYWHGNPLKYRLDNLNLRQIKQKLNDEVRNKELISKGYKIMRLWESDINKMNIEKFKDILRCI